MGTDATSFSTTRHGWDRLDYDPPHALRYLTGFRTLVADFTPLPDAAPAWGDWRVPPDPALLALCTRHGVFAGEYRCRFCEPGVV